jgi:hypothetical protein
MVELIKGLFAKPETKTAESYKPDTKLSEEASTRPALLLSDRQTALSFVDLKISVTDYLTGLKSGFGVEFEGFVSSRAYSGGRVISDAFGSSTLGRGNRDKTHSLGGRRRP